MTPKIIAPKNLKVAAVFAKVVHMTLKCFFLFWRFNPPLSLLQDCLEHLFSAIWSCSITWTSLPWLFLRRCSQAGLHRAVLMHANLAPINKSHRAMHLLRHLRRITLPLGSLNHPRHQQPPLGTTKNLNNVKHSPSPLTNKLRWLSQARVELSLVIPFVTWDRLWQNVSLIYSPGLLRPSDDPARPAVTNRSVASQRARRKFFSVLSITIVDASTIGGLMGRTQ